MAASLISLLKGRRSIYALTNQSPIPNSKIEEIVQQVLLYTPSAFNTQSTRILILFGDNHRKLWDITKQTLQPLVPAEQAAQTEAKLGAFQSAYASILFFEDPRPYAPLGGFKMYADQFPGWRQQTNGMHQLLTWTALSNEGLGANLQHYNPVIDDEVKKTWSVDKEWELVAQLVIGKPAGDTPAEKEKKPLQDRLKVVG